MDTTPTKALDQTLPGMIELQKRMAKQRDILKPFKTALLDAIAFSVNRPF